MNHKGRANPLTDRKVVGVVFFPTSLCGVLTFCSLSAASSSRRLPPSPISTCLYQQVSTNVSLSTCLYHNLSLSTCLYPLVSIKLSLSTCLYLLVSINLSLSTCLYQLVFINLSLSTCLYQLVFINLSLSTCQAHQLGDCLDQRCRLGNVAWQARHLVTLTVVAGRLGRR